MNTHTHTQVHGGPAVLPHARFRSVLLEVSSTTHAHTHTDEHTQVHGSPAVLPRSQFRSVLLEVNEHPPPPV
eukprot:2510948-Pyramimonas_sp.AAC.1